jgi:hypothetical protein
MRSLFASCILLLAGAGVVAAPNPNIPSSELPGRERQRFLESPVDRFTQPKQKAKPLWRWDCEQPKPPKRKPGAKRSRRC